MSFRDKETGFKKKKKGNLEGMHFLTERGHRAERIKAARQAENEGLFTFYFFTPAAHMGI